MHPSEQTSAYRIKWNEVTWYSRLIATVIFSILIAGAFCFGAWYQKIHTQANPNPVSGNITYKQGPFGGEVPSTWSIVSGAGDEVAPVAQLDALTSSDNLVASFAPTQVSFGDGAFEQVDFHVITQSAVQELLTKASQSGASTTQETVGGVQATVLHYPTDDGQVDKDGPGGKDYIIGTGTSPSGSKTFLLMRDWSLGDSAFESGFQHFLATADFTSGW